jgi:hypothetical protein
MGTEKGTQNGLHGTIGTENGTLNGLQGTIRKENRTQNGCDLRIYISENLAVYYCYYYYLDIYF